MDLDLCCGCGRHVRATETTCPFCGAARAPGAPSPHARNLGGLAPRSRAQRYVLGAAVAAGIGIAKASGATSADAGSNTMAVAAEPTPEAAEEDAGATLYSQGVPEGERDHWRERHQGNPCTSTGGCCGGTVICPPYGCVFPDEACDIVHV